MSFSIGDLLAVGSEFEFGGVKYNLRRPTLLEQARFSQWLEDDAKCEAGRGDIPDDIRANLFRAVMRDIGEKYYEVDSPGYIAALQVPRGIAKLLHIILETDHPGIPEEVVHGMLEQGLKEKFLQLVAAEQDDPKVVAAVAAMLGLPPGWLNTSDNSSSESSTSTAPDASTPSAV